MNNQPLNADNMPLSALPSARIADPGTKPSNTQSIVLVMSKTAFVHMQESTQQALLRNRCILVLGGTAEADPGFTLETISRYHNPYVDCEVHGI